MEDLKALYPILISIIKFLPLTEVAINTKQGCGCHSVSHFLNFNLPINLPSHSHTCQSSSCHLLPTSSSSLQCVPPAHLLPITQSLVHSCTHLFTNEISDAYESSSFCFITDTCTIASHSCNFQPAPLCDCMCSWNIL